MKHWNSIKERRYRLIGGITLTLALLATTALIPVMTSASAETQDYPRKSYFVSTIGDTEQVVHYEIPFGVRSVRWSHTADTTELWIEFEGDFAPYSKNYDEIGYALEIFELTAGKDRAVWYGHNLYHTAIGQMAESEVALVSRTDGSKILAKGTIEFDPKGRTARIVIPVPSFEPMALYFYYFPSQQALERGGSRLLAGSWKRNPETQRVRSIMGGQLKWRE